MEFPTSWLQTDGLVPVALTVTAFALGDETKKTKFRVNVSAVSALVLRKFTGLLTIFLHLN